MPQKGWLFTTVKMTLKKARYPEMMKTAWRLVLSLWSLTSLGSLFLVSG